MKNEWELKKQFVEIGRRIWERNYVAANDGNLTVRLNDKEILTTPTGVSKGFMSTEMIIKVDYDGKVISGNPDYRPSSEVKMHIDVYKQRPDIHSVVHAHPPYATSFAVAGIPLDKCILPEAVIVIGAVPIAEYGLPSTDELPDKIRPYIQKSDAVLLQNHGALTLGTNLLNAYHKMETLEHTANIVWKAMQLGSLNVFSDEERDRLMNLRDKFNITGKVMTCSTDQNLPAAGESSFYGQYNSSNISDKQIDEIAKEIAAKLKIK